MVYLLRVEGVNVKDNNLSIVVKDVDKDFIIVSDKANTLKERVIRFSNKKQFTAKSFFCLLSANLFL